MMRYLFVILFLGATNLFAQTPAEDKLGNWLMYFGNNKLSDKYSIHTEAQLRLYETTGNFNQLLLRIGVNRRISPQAMVTLGYGYIPTESFNKDETKINTTEHRVWQQLILTNGVGRVFFEHRYRLEQRWISSSAAEDSYLNRARYRILANIPLNKAQMEVNTLFLSVYDEIFLNINDTPFDQNRLYGALGYKFSKSFSMQAGYLRHRAGKANYDRLQLGLFLNTDFSKPSAN